MRMEKKNIVIASVIGVGVIGVVIGGIWKTDSGPKSEKNYGLSHIEQNVNGGKVDPFDADSVVPTPDDLIKNLEDKKYKVTKYESFTEKNIPCNRIYAEKGDKCIDICYGLDIETASKAFCEYEKMYDTYYVLAQNEEYVYCVRDKGTFKNAGFDSLANNGVQYINY